MFYVFVAALILTTFACGTVLLRRRMVPRGFEALNSLRTCPVDPIYDALVLFESVKLESDPDNGLLSKIGGAEQLKLMAWNSRCLVQVIDAAFRVAPLAVRDEVNEIGQLAVRTRLFVFLALHPLLYRTLLRFTSFIPHRTVKLAVSSYVQMVVRTEAMCAELNPHLLARLAPIR